ncbi:hypothetical protein [Sporofaciens sp. JLR.KK001]|uniref:hypothetical protein n=1 Tax=Sporofaciens sp. JLR.KK001 TaxID=3112621 RepID=UPI002FEF49BA
MVKRKKKISGYSSYGLQFTPMVLAAANQGYFKLPYGKRPDSCPDNVLVCDRAAWCTVQG